MDILTLILLYLLNQNVPIVHEILLILFVFGVLAITWALLLLIITGATTFFAIMVLPAIFKSTFRLGLYHSLPQENHREYYSKKLNAVLKENFVVGICLFITLIYIFNSVPSSFFSNESCGALNTTLNQSLPVASQSSIPLPVPTAALTATLVLIPTFLLSLRLLANPTEGWIRRVIRFQNRSHTEIRDKVRYFKDQVTSFFYSFVIGTLILVYLSLCFTAIMLKINNVNDYYRLFCPFAPKMDFYSLIFFAILEIIIIIMTSMLGEWYLKNSPPFDQLPVDLMDQI
jgi:hypothetical protein